MCLVGDGLLFGNVCIRGTRPLSSSDNAGLGVVVPSGFGAGLILPGGWMA
jgi:hypothetical protein